MILFGNIEDNGFNLLKDFAIRKANDGITFFFVGPASALGVIGDLSQAILAISTTHCYRGRTVAENGTVVGHGVMSAAAGGRMRHKPGWGRKVPDR